MTTLSKQELIEFRKKLVWAKQSSQMDDYCAPHFHTECFGLELCRNYDYSGCDSLHEWLEQAPIEKRIAMWDNSIAHVDKLIAEAK